MSNIIDKIASEQINPNVPEFKDNRADFKMFTEQKEEVEETPLDQLEKTKDEIEDKQEDVIEDISFATKKPIVSDDDLPPFLRKLRK